MTRVLVVDDEPSLRELLSFNLRKEGYEVLEAADGPQALKMATSEPVDLVILDLMLPGMDGFEVCRLLRSEKDVPIIMLTARGEEVDRVVGFEVGADDYVVKPFSPREFLLRVRAILRRSGEGGDRESGCIAVSDLIIDEHRREVRLRGERLNLTMTEFRLLKTLAESPGRVLSRDQLLNEVWGYDFAGDTRTVDVHIRHLREKLADDPAEPRYIETVRGAGYRFIERQRDGRKDDQ